MKGEMGDIGPVGAKVMVRRQGPPGANGNDGLKGAAGEKGRVDPAGSPGMKGMPGQEGDMGISVSIYNLVKKSKLKVDRIKFDLQFFSIGPNEENLLIVKNNTLLLQLYYCLCVKIISIPTL